MRQALERAEPVDDRVIVELSPEQQAEIARLAGELNDRLVQAGSTYAERAFGLSCGLGFLPALTLLVILFALRLINVILAFTLFIIVLLGLTGLANLLAYTARLNAVRNTYREQVQPEIVSFLEQNKLTRLHFDTCAVAGLAEGAPLVMFLDPALPEAARKDEIDEENLPGDTLIGR